MSNHKTQNGKQKATERESTARYEIRLSGSGGQGLIFAGVALAQAITTLGVTARRPEAEPHVPIW
jgi:hypothetical protein